jgi:hypothetical protein
LEDAIAAPASPAHDAAIPPKNLLRSLEIGVERPVSLKEFTVAVFPFIAALRMTHYTSDFVVLDTCGVSSRTCLPSLGSCSARANHFQGFGGVPIFGVQRERFAQFLGAPLNLTLPAESQA